jgi:CheY-like chemotaxis protein
VVVNLINNAAKYTPEGGNISVQLRVAADAVVLNISDNGIGMARELVLRVFDLFTQAQRSSDRSQGGLGIGLPLVKSLVELHGGSVSAESGGIGKGSIFTVRLPRLTSDSSKMNALQTSKDQPSTAVQPLRVLVVDDNADAADVLTLLLEAHGHEVFTEYAVPKAIERAQRTSPHVCLLDIGLPDIDGYELARRLRVMPEMAKAVLIAVSGYGQEQDKKKSAEAGFDYHFVKPINTTKLATLLAKIRAT